MKHLKLEIKNKMAVLEWDQSNSPVNLVCEAFIEELSLIIKELDPSQVKALVFLSGKKKGFSAGADIKEIQNSKQELETKLTEVNQLFLKFENLNLFKIVAIDGDCLGGGLEWALCFDRILVSDSDSTKLALPEVKLGLIPGFGGCFRLPKKVGLLEALKMICSGKSLNSKKAFHIGLADELVPQLLLKKRALNLAEQALFFTKKKKPYFYWRDLFFHSLICFVFKLKIKEKTKDFYPAPLTAIQLISKGSRFSISSKLLKYQKEFFRDLAFSKTAQNLISLFLQSRQAKKKLSSLLNGPQEPIQKIGVLGAGVMGSSIACLLADKGFEVRLIDSDTTALQKALKKRNLIFQKQRQKKKINSYQEDYKRNLLSVSQNFWGLKNRDLIIECLPENLKLKKELISFVSKKLHSGCLFASNSSSLSVQELAQSSQRPELFFGLHFFNPVDKMPLVEICYDEAQKEKLSALPSFIQKIGKTPLIVKDSPCFVVNRVLVSYLLESLLLLEKGYAVLELDALFKEKGFPLGPFETMDKIGLDTCVQVISNLKEKEVGLKAPHWVEDIVKILGLGEKDQKGFYLYTHPYLNKKEVNPKTEIIKKEELAVEGKTEELFQNILNQMSETGKSLIEKKVVENEESLDMALVLGSGFPAFMGGPMKQSLKERLC